MRSPALALALAGLVALAGCLSPEEEPAVDAASADTPRGAAPAGGGAASGSAARAASGGEDADAAAANASASAEPITTTLAWDGSTASAVCVMPAQRCDILQQPESSWNEFSTLGIPGRAIRASGTLTWEPATPATEELHVFLFSLDETGMPVDSTRITGPSPLAFDVDLSEWTGVEFAYSLHGHHEVGPLIVETSQPFHMETTILSMPS